MAEPRTTPQEHDKPVFQPATPGEPTPEDPREREPIHDPPINPEQDNPVRQAGGNNDVERGMGTPSPADNVIFDENPKPG
jgi:hypothetical protein